MPNLAVQVAVVTGAGSGSGRRLRKESQRAQ